jgi:hypothetical protein
VIWIVGIGGIVLGVGRFASACLFQILLGDRATQGDMALGLLGVGLVFGGWTTLRRTHQTSGVHVSVFTEGLVRKQDDQLEVVRWGEIGEVQRGVSATKMQGFTIGKPQRLLLVCRDGRRLEFNETLARLGDLRKLVEERTHPLLLRSSLDAYNAGEAVPFDALIVSRTGLQYFRETLPWDQFDRAEVTGGRLLIWSKDRRQPRFTVPFINVSNLHVLLVFLEEIRRPRLE